MHTLRNELQEKTSALLDISFFYWLPDWVIKYLLLVNELITWSGTLSQGAPVRVASPSMARPDTRAS